MLLGCPQTPVRAVFAPSELPGQGQAPYRAGLLRADPCISRHKGVKRGRLLQEGTQALRGSWGVSPRVGAGTGLLPGASLGTSAGMEGGPLAVGWWGVQEGILE